MWEVLVINLTAKYFFISTHADLRKRGSNMINRFISG